MVPRVLAAIQGRRLVAEVIEAALASGDAPGPIRDLARHKQEMRDVLEQLQRAEGGETGGLLGGGGIDGDGTRGMESFGGLASGIERRRDEAAIGALRERFRAQEVELGRLKAVAAEVPGFEILGAPLGTMTTERLQAVLGSAEALVLAFPTAAKAREAAKARDKDEVGTASAQTGFDTHLWVLRATGAPTLIRLPAADGISGTNGLTGAETNPTETAASAAPDAWSRDLPGIVARVADFAGSMSAGRGMRQGGWRLPPEEPPVAAGTGPTLTTARKADVTLPEPAVARLDAVALRGFWPQLDAAMARLVWHPLRDSGMLAGTEQILITTAGPLHNLPFEAGRHSAGLGTPDLWHASSLVDFALGRGIYGRAAPPPDAAPTPADVGSLLGGAEELRSPRVSLLTNSASTDIPMATLESALAARIWTEAIGATGVIRDERYPWSPALPVDLAHAACHGSVDRDSPTPRPHLILAGPEQATTVSERDFLRGPSAREMLICACVAAQTFDDLLDGNPTGVVSGVRRSGTGTLVAALPPVPDHAGFLFGVAVTLLMARWHLRLAPAAAIARRLIGGLGSEDDVDDSLANDTDGISSAVEPTPQGLRAALDEVLLDHAADLICARRDSLVRGVAHAASRRSHLRRSLLTLGCDIANRPPSACWWLDLDDQTADHLAQALLDDTGAPTLADPHELLCAHLRPYLLPDRLRSPEALGVLRYGMVTYGDPTASHA